jgi:hypothetical protein
VFQGQTPRKGREKNMITLYVLFIALLALGIIARRWGVDSSDGINSLEWQRRQNWPGFH